MEDFKCASLDVEVVLGDRLEHLLRKHHVSSFPVSFHVFHSGRQWKLRIERPNERSDGSEEGKKSTYTRRLCRNNWLKVSLSFSKAHKWVAAGELTDRSSESNQ